MDEQIDRVNDILKQLLSGQDDQDRIKDFFIEGDKPGVLKLPTMMLMRLNIKDTWVTTVIATRPDTHEIIPK